VKLGAVAEGQGNAGHKAKGVVEGQGYTDSIGLDHAEGEGQVLRLPRQVLAGATHPFVAAVRRRRDKNHRGGLGQGIALGKQSTGQQRTLESAAGRGRGTVGGPLLGAPLQHLGAGPGDDRP